MAASNGAKFDATMDFLAPDPAFAGYEDADVATMRAFGLRPPLRS
ncbi:hypothetical protein OCJ37_14250 [Xanthomonas sp. AM6]|nr:hypothetical protein [Xanthomonas sp. AM6]UYB51147.1 hypothetical protein OCJ37_14250 [Xanthomonas sp. AM6]